MLFSSLKQHSSEQQKKKATRKKRVALRENPELIYFFLKKFSFSAIELFNYAASARLVTLLPTSA